MPRRRRVHVEGGFYHVTLRGNHRQAVFSCDADRGLLNMIVARSLEKYDARLHAYCWMGNHLHFLIQVGQQSLANIMRQIAGEFARVMQSRMPSNGHFFERRYHATLIEATDYLFTALHYIHRNPVEAGLAQAVEQYRWSSHHAYCGRKNEPWLTTSFILGKFASDRRDAIRAYRAFIALERQDMASPFPEGAFIFGSDEFIDRIGRVESKQQAGQDLQGLIGEACTRFEVSREQLLSPVRTRYLTKVRAWIAHQAGVRGIAGRSAVARELGRSEGTLRSAILMYPDELD